MAKNSPSKFEQLYLHLSEEHKKAFRNFLRGDKGKEKSKMYLLFEKVILNQSSSNLTREEDKMLSSLGTKLEDYMLEKVIEKESRYLVLVRYYATNNIQERIGDLLKAWKPKVKPHEKIEYLNYEIAYMQLIGRSSDSEKTILAELKKINTFQDIIFTALVEKSTLFPIEEYTVYLGELTQKPIVDFYIQLYRAYINETFEIDKITCLFQQIVLLKAEINPEHLSNLYIVIYNIISQRIRKSYSYQDVELVGKILQVGMSEKWLSYDDIISPKNYFKLLWNYRLCSSLPKSPFTELDSKYLTSFKFIVDENDFYSRCAFVLRRWMQGERSEELIIYINKFVSKLVPPGSEEQRILDELHFIALKIEYELDYEVDKLEYKQKNKTINMLAPHLQQEYLWWKFLIAALKEKGTSRYHEKLKREEKILKTKLNNDLIYFDKKWYEEQRENLN